MSNKEGVGRVYPDLLLLPKYYEEEIDYILTFHALDIDTRRTQEISIYYYNEDEEIVDDINYRFWPDHYYEVIPGSLVEKFYDAMMEIFNTKAG